MLAVRPRWPKLVGHRFQLFPRRNFNRTSFYIPSFRTFHNDIPRKRLLWLLPLGGGIALWLAPQKNPDLSTTISSPALIPCPHAGGNTEAEWEGPRIILSPDEERRTIVSRISRVVQIYFWEPILITGRFVRLLIIFVPVIITSPMLLIGKPEAAYGGERQGAVWWYAKLAAAMEHAGPTFIKLAQWASTRTDLFPSVLCDRLSRMHSSGKPHSLHYSRRVIERVFQRAFEDVFEEFDEIPIGVGAIAQVHRATLRRDILPPSYLNPKRPKRSGAAALRPTVDEPPPSVPSASVAIKILHPRVHKNIQRDLCIMNCFAHLITLFPGMEWISLPEEVETFGRMMNGQLDLRNEASNLEVFERNFAPRKSPVSFPRPLSLFSSQEVLVEEFENALPLKAFLRNGGGPYDNQIAELGLDAFLHMLLLDNFVHADLHPGNIMIKFYKSSTEALLRNIASSIFGAPPTPDNLHANGDESDNVVNKLRHLSNDPEKWRAELRSLAKEGYQPEIVFIDTGLVTTLDGVNRKNFLDLFRAIAQFDGYRAGKLMVERCRTPHLAIETETFALKMQHIVLSVKRKTFSLGSIKISDILTDVLKAVRQHHVKMEGDFINTVLSVLLLEGIGRQLDSNIDLFKSALPILRKLGRKTAEESLEAGAELPKGNVAAYLKMWVYIEARQLASAALVNADELIRYDWLTPNV